MTVSLVQGASVSGLPSAAAPAGNWTQGRAGRSLLEPSLVAAPGRSTTRPAAGFPSPGSILEVTQSCITCARPASLTRVNFGGHAGLLSFPAFQPVQDGPVVFGLPGPSCLVRCAPMTNGLYY